MIVVTGASGQLGSAIVKHLLALVPAEQIGVSVRDPASVTALADRGIRVRAGDFTDPDSLVSAFQGAEQVLVVSAAIRGPGASEANRRAIDAAVSAGASRILYTSHQAASPTSHFPAAVEHAATEAHLAQVAATGVSTTALRNGFYASTLAHYLPSAIDTGKLVLPADGPFSWTDHADLAEAAALALADPSRGNEALGGPVVTLTAHERLDFAEVAELAGQMIGRPIERVLASDEEWRASALADGMPAGAADFTLGLFRAARSGEFDVVDPTLERVLGHPLTTVRSVLERMVGK